MVDALYDFTEGDMVKSATSCGIFMQVKKSEEKDLSHQEAIQMRR